MKTRTVAVVLVLALGLGSVCGCSQPLLSPEENRSQYDNYDKLRNQYADQVHEDAYGRPRPNLRARLQPKE